MRLGISLGDDITLHEQCTVAQDVERAGLASLWVPDALARDPFVICHAWAQATTAPSLGVGVAQVLTRSAVQHAKAAATLQEASNGRFILGLGASRAAAMAWHGVRYERPIDALRDALRILRSVLDGEETDYTGPVFSSRGFRINKDLHPVAVPLYLGAGGPRSLALAGELADGVLLSWKSPVGVQSAARLVRSAAEEAGRPVPEIAGYVRLALAEDRGEARAALARQICFYWQFHATDFARQLPEDRFVSLDAAYRAGGASALEAELDDRTIREFGWFGTPSDDITETLDRFQEAGLEHMVLRVVPVGDAAADARAGVAHVSHWTASQADRHSG